MSLDGGESTMAETHTPIRYVYSPLFVSSFSVLILSLSSHSLDERRRRLRPFSAPYIAISHCSSAAYLRVNTHAQLPYHIIVGVDYLSTHPPCQAHLLFSDATDAVGTGPIWPIINRRAQWATVRQLRQTFRRRPLRHHPHSSSSSRL